MTFRDWQEMPPDKAAREIHSRVRALPKAQQRAVMALVNPKEDLVARFKSAPRGTPLGGVPFFAKDLFDFADLPTMAGSRFLDRVRPAPARDGAFARSLRAAGAVFAGKTQMHEFAYGITGENPHFGDCEHPRFPGRTTGGSSSGSAAAVAAGIVPLALGSDTGGSIRVPAAFCGLFGFRLMPGQAFIKDAFPLAPTFDTAGWLTADADAMRATFSTLVNLRANRSTPRGCYLEFGTLDREVATACQTVALRLTGAANAATREALTSGFAPSLEAYHTIVSVEAARVHQPWAQQYQNEYDPNVWQRLTRAQSVTRAQADGALTTLREVRAVWAKYFETHDFLVMPATPTAAPTKAACTPELRNRLLTITAPVSLGGLPALTIPVPLPSGLTAGLQIVAAEAESPVFAWALDRVDRS